MSNITIIDTSKKVRARSKTEQLQKKKKNRESKLQHMTETGVIRRVPMVAGNRQDRANMLIPRPGPVPILASKRRSLEVRSNFNDHELAELDAQRSAIGFKRGEWLRMCWLRTIPMPKIPTVNIFIFNATANIASNLVQISRKLEDQELLQVAELASRSLSRFRSSLSQYIDMETPAQPVRLLDDRSSRRGPNPIASSERRTRSVSVCLTPAESKKLDLERGKSRRGEWIRMIWQNVEPTSRIPTMSKSEFSVIDRTALEINSIAYELNSKNTFNKEFVMDTLANFRIAVIKLEGALK